MDQDIAYPAKVMARLLDLTQARVGQLAKEGIITRTDTGKYPPEAIRDYVRYLRDRAYGKDMRPSDQHTERTRLLKGQADKVELEVGELERSLIPAEAVEAAWLDHVMSARAVLLALPTKLAPAVMGATTMREVEEFARDEIYRALDALETDTTPDQDKSERSVPEASDIDSESVGAKEEISVS